MRILVLNYEFPPIGGGGGQASADICEKLVELGHDVRVLTSGAADLAPESQRDGYLVRRVSTGRKSPSSASFIDMAAYVVGGLLPGLRLMRDWEPHIMHAHFAVPTGVLAWLLFKFTRTPYVLTVHLGDVPGGVPEKTDAWFRWVKPLTPSIWHDASQIAAVSEHTRKLAVATYDVDVDVIPNGVELSRRSGARPVGLPPRLVFAGRFQPQKNLLFLVDALAAIRDMRWTCHLIGDGPQRQRIEKELARLGLTDRVILTGWVTPEEVRDRFASSDVLVMPSLWEGLPVVGVQGLAEGLAIVANRAGGLTELVEDGQNGRVCDPGDEPCFVEALKWVLGDYERLLRMKERSLKVAERYDIKTVSKSYENLFLGIVGEG